MSNRTGIKTGAPAAAAAVRLALSYQVSHALYVATRLGIWDLLAAEVCTISEIASRAGTHVQSMLRLLRALAAFDLVRDVGAGRFELTLVGECLTSNSTSSVRPLVLMYGSEHARQMFGHLEQCIATGRSAFEIAFGAASGFSYLQGRPDLAQVFNDGMSAASRFTGAAIIKSYDFDGVRQVIDVGGGHGEVLAAILHAYPHLRATLFELPSVIQGASGKIAGADLRGRCALVECATLPIRSRVRAAVSSTDVVDSPAFARFHVFTQPGSFPEVAAVLHRVRFTPANGHRRLD